MKLTLISSTSRALLAAGLFAAVASAQAASGFTVSHEQESMVQAGMSTSEVEQALGRPAERMHYLSEAGPTWTYTLNGPQDPVTVFVVQFGADGHVVSTSELLEQTD